MLTTRTQLQTVYHSLVTQVSEIYFYDATVKLNITASVLFFCNIMQVKT
jgi:hypothetical protein